MVYLFQKIALKKCYLIQKLIFKIYNPLYLLARSLTFPRSLDSRTTKMLHLTFTIMTNSQVSYLTIIVNTRQEIILRSRFLVYYLALICWVGRDEKLRANDPEATFLNYRDTVGRA